MLRITDWDKHFENNRTRELKRLQWIPLPNKHDGDGYTELMDHEDGVAHYGAWVLIIQVASKCDPRGTLLRGCKNPYNNTNIPHDYRSLSRITRCPENIIKNAIVRLKNIGWIEEIELETPISQEGAVTSQEGAPLESQEGALNGMEKKRINNITISPSLTCELFETARRIYPGTKRGYAPEFENFKKKNADYKEILPLLAPAIEREIAHKDALKAANQFCPSWANFQTWINQKRWTQEFTAQPLSSQPYQGIKTI